MTKKHSFTSLARIVVIKTIPITITIFDTQNFLCDAKSLLLSLFDSARGMSCRRTSVQMLEILRIAERTTLVIVTAVSKPFKPKKNVEDSSGHP